MSDLIREVENGILNKKVCWLKCMTAWQSRLPLLKTVRAISQCRIPSWTPVELAIDILGCPDLRKIQHGLSLEMSCFRIDCWRKCFQVPTADNEWKKPWRSVIKGIQLCQLSTLYFCELYILNHQGVEAAEDFLRDCKSCNAQHVQG